MIDVKAGLAECLMARFVVSGLSARALFLEFTGLRISQPGVLIHLVVRILVMCGNRHRYSRREEPDHETRYYHQQGYPTSQSLHAIESQTTTC
jgi:hypothetical protein